MAVHRRAVVNGPVEHRLSDDIRLSGLLRPRRVVEKLVRLSVFLKLFLRYRALEAVVAKALHGGGRGGGHGHHRPRLDDDGTASRPGRGLERDGALGELGSLNRIEARGGCDEGNIWVSELKERSRARLNRTRGISSTRTLSVSCLGAATQGLGLGFFRAQRRSVAPEEEIAIAIAQTLVEIIASGEKRRVERLSVGAVATTLAEAPRACG